MRKVIFGIIALFVGIMAAAWIVAEKADPVMLEPPAETDVGG